MLYGQIGNNIKRLRRERGMTQSELSKLLRISHQMISRYENGWAVPDIAMLVKICDIFHTSLDGLCGTDASSREAFVRRLVEKYSEKLCSSYLTMYERYESFLSEAETVMNDDRVMQIQLFLLEELHDNIENDLQKSEVNEKIFECASRILDISRDDTLRSYANYRMAVYCLETPFDSEEYSRNLALSKEYSNKILLCTYFPEYTPSFGINIRSDEYLNVQKSNIKFFMRKLYNAMERLNKRGRLEEEKYKELFSLLENII